jgi:hypothetical protein
MSLIFDSINHDDPFVRECVKENLKKIVNQAIDNESFMSLIEKLYYLNRYGDEAVQQTGQQFDVKIYPNSDNSFDLTWIIEPRPGIRKNWMYGGLNYHEHSNSWSVNT